MLSKSLLISLAPGLSIHHWLGIYFTPRAPLSIVEISDCEKPTADSNDKLACHLSCSQLLSENVEDEIDLLSW